MVIDGQQRLTTIMLLIEALARALGGEDPLNGFSAKKLRNYYLLNPGEDGESHYKLVLSQTDKASLKALLDQQANRRRGFVSNTSGSGRFGSLSVMETGNEWL